MELQALSHRGRAGCTLDTGHPAVRIALYSHDTLGIGHLRRNLRIARSLADAGSAGILLITGAREAGIFAMPEGIDCLTLPSLRKDDSGQYATRSLGVPVEQLIHLRSATLTAALDAFAPDVLIVDKVPRGALGELDSALEALRLGGRTRCVLGLREVLDDPATVRREWREQRAREALRDYFDAIWIYGDPRVYDPVREYGLTAGAGLPVRYVGYLDSGAQGSPLPGVPDEVARELGLPPGRLVLCVVGGGQDGAALATAFCQTCFPPDRNAVLVTGPFMPAEIRERLQRSTAGRPRFRVLEFVADPERLVRAADRVISMGGYNTVSEVLAAGKDALVVPRVHPRREQLIRAERLRDLNLLDVLLPHELCPAALSDWLSKDLPARPAARECIDFGGSSRLPRLLNELLADERVPDTANQEELCLVTAE